MSDRELLVLAAKAAGLTIEYWNDGLEPHSSGEGFIIVGDKLWNSLTDDGDALRLAVELDAAIYFYKKTKEVEVESYDLRVSVREWCGDDKQAATRRAITRFAAEIERNKAGGGVMAALALWIGNAVMAIGGVCIVAGLLTGCAYLCNSAIRKSLDAYGGWNVFLQFRDWYHKTQKDIQ